MLHVHLDQISIINIIIYPIGEIQLIDLIIYMKIHKLEYLNIKKMFKTKRLN
jgi:hypothetical protein